MPILKEYLSQRSQRTPSKDEKERGGIVMDSNGPVFLGDLGVLGESLFLIRIGSS